MAAENVSVLCAVQLAKQNTSCARRALSSAKTRTSCCKSATVCSGSRPPAAVADDSKPHTSQHASLPSLTALHSGHLDVNNQTRRKRQGVCGGFAHAIVLVRVRRIRLLRSCASDLYPTIVVCTQPQISHVGVASPAVVGASTSPAHEHASRLCELAARQRAARPGAKTKQE